MTETLCSHPDTREWYEDDKAYPSYYQCTTCGDLFPVIGDTDQWKPAPYPPIKLTPDDGAWSDNGVCWVAVEHYPKRSEARTFFSKFTGCDWIEVRVLKRYARYAPYDLGASEFDGEFWIECDADHPCAFPVWRCE